MDKKANQITEGVIWKQLLIFFFPIAVGTFFQQLYNMVDTIVVGHFVGKEALASVGGSSSQLANFVVGFFTGFTSGTSVIISQAIGAKNDDMVQKGLHTSLTLSIAAGIVISVIGVIFAPNFLEWMNTPPEIMKASAEYLKIYFSGIVFLFIYNMGSGILRAAGDSKSPLYFLICSCILNIILDLAFVIGLRLGVKGVGYATVISEAFSAGLVVYKLTKQKGNLKLSFGKLRLNGKVLKRQLKIGLPTGFESVLFSITNIAIQATLNGFGTDTMAAWSSYGKIDAFYWMINGAFGISITTFVGQNYGAGRMDRVHKSTRICLAMQLGITAVFIAVILLLREQLIGIFTTDRYVIEIGANMMRLISPWYLSFVFIEILSGSLRGRGNVIVPVIITLFGVCVMRIVWLFTAVKISPALPTLVMSYPVTWVITAVVFIVYYILQTRKEKA